MLTAADYLQMYTLRDKCASEICVTAKNVLSLYDFAVSVNMQTLKQKCSEFMKKHFDEVVQEREFLELGQSEVIGVLQHVQERSEDVKLKSVFHWASHDTVSRSSHLDNLMAAVKLDECSLGVMTTVLQKYEAVIFSKRWLYQSLTTAIATTTMSSQYISTVKPSKSSKQVVAIVGGYVDGDFQRKVWTVNHSNQVEELRVMPSDFEEWHSVCAIPVGFALTGGHNSKMCAIYIALTNSWSRMEDMSEIRRSHGSICVDNVLYVLAGLIGPDTEESASVESMSLKGNAWTPCAALSVRTYDPQIASIGTSIYLVDSLHSKRLFTLDINRDDSRWMERASLPTSIDDSTCGSVDDKLCVVGGYDRLCVWYHPAADTWVEAQQKPRLHHVYGAAVVVSGNILLLGGNNGYGTDESESLDVNEDKWSDANISLPYLYWDHHAVLLDVSK